MTWRRCIWLLPLLAVALGPVGWVTTDVLERDNDFCNACHLSEGVPLHVDIRRDFDGRPPATLAAAHGAALVEDRGFRCIDCHGGVSWIGRTRVKALAAKDAFWWVVGHFDEPEGMAWPLWDEDCRQCHETFPEADPDAPSPPFHSLGVHNVELGVTCVECHLSHEKGGNVVANFLHPALVRAQCAQCHSEYEDHQDWSAGIDP